MRLVVAAGYFRTIQSNKSASTIGWPVSSRTICEGKLPPSIFANLLFAYRSVDSIPEDVSIQCRHLGPGHSASLTRQKRIVRCTAKFASHFLVTPDQRR